MKRALAALVVLLAVVAPAQPAAGQARDIDNGCPANTPEDGFADVPASNGHERAVDCIVWWEITQGTASGNYQPAQAVTRAQMASFIARLVDRSGVTFPTFSPDAFDDDDFTTHEQNTNRLAEVGIVQGTGTRRYSPNRNVTRAEMATFLVRAYQFISTTPLPAGPDAFDDDTDNRHEDNINRAAAAGLAAGSGNRTFRPAAAVRRDEMGSFIGRTLDLMVDSLITPVPVGSITFSGTGDLRSNPFRLRSGDYKVAWRYDNPDCGHIASMQNTNRDRPGFESLPSDDDGRSGETNMFDVEAEEYFLEMGVFVYPETPCPWQITISRIAAP